MISDDSPIDRGGLGAVLGSKRIKAIVIQEGDYEILPVDPDLMEAGKQKLRTVCTKSPYAGTIRSQGSLGLMDHAMAKGFAAVENFSKRTDPRLCHLDGIESVRRFSQEPSPCGLCTLECKRTTRLSDGSSAVLPDYEVVAILGGNLGNYDPLLVVAWYREIVRMGLDPISTGNVLGWAMEAQQRGGHRLGSCSRFWGNGCNCFHHRAHRSAKRNRCALVSRSEETFRVLWWIRFRLPCARARNAPL